MSGSFLIPKISLRIPLRNLGFSIIITFIKTLRYLLMMRPRTMTATERTATINDFGQIIATIIPTPKAEKYSPNRQPYLPLLIKTPPQLFTNILWWCSDFVTTANPLCS